MRRRRMNPCLDKMQRKILSHNFNSCLASLSTMVGSFWYIPPLGMEEWDDEIHLATAEHMRYIHHIADAMGE